MPCILFCSQPLNSYLLPSPIHPCFTTNLFPTFMAFCFVCVPLDMNFLKILIYVIKYVF